MSNYPSIKEIKQLYQPDPKQETVWYARAMIRDISAIFTWFLIRTPLSANQATIIQAILGIAGAVLLAFGKRDAAILAVVLIQLGYIFDCVDGEIARFRKKPTVNGIFLDSLNHAIVIPIMFWGLAVYSYFLTNEIWILFIGIILGLIAANPVKKGVLSTLFYMIERKDDPKYNIANLKSDLKIDESDRNNSNIKNGYYIGKKTLFQQIFNWLKALSEYPASMNIITIVVIVDIIIFNYTNLNIFPLPAILMIAYTIFLLAKEVLFLFKVYSKRKIEKKFLDIIK